MPRYNCPHCQSASFDFLSKLLSSHTHPTVCKFCSAKSFAPSSQGSGVMVLNTFLLTSVGFAASYWQSWWPMLPGIALIFGLWLFLLHLRPMAVETAFHPSQVGKMAILDGLAVIATVANP